MKDSTYKIAVAAIFAASVTVQANAKPHSKPIVVVSPSVLPEIAQRNSEGMYLHETGVGKTVLYLEQDRGRTLSILDVSDAAAIQAVGQATLPAHGPYDFVESIADSAVLIRYRDGSGFAVINFKKFKNPSLAEASQIQDATCALDLGHEGPLLTSSSRSDQQAEGLQYQVFDVSNPANPLPLATIAKVRQHLERAETGTLFPLNDSGLTLIRRPASEELYRIESTFVN